MLRMILSLTLAATAARAQPGDVQPLRRVVALLDYVGGDYARAVGEHGEVLSQAEHSEQIGFVEDAARELRADVNGSGEDLAKRLDALRQRVAERAPPAEVAQSAQAVRDEIVQRFNVVLLPQRAPDVRRGKQVYAQACAACHGADGHPNLALGLETRPPDFQSETRALGRRLLHPLARAPGPVVPGPGAGARRARAHPIRRSGGAFGRRPAPPAG